MARKGWDDLSPSYRQRLERGGISRSQYQRGASLHTARGHVSSSHEAELKEARIIEKYVDYYKHWYSFVDEDDLRQTLEAMSGQERGQWIRAQRDAQDAYHNVSEAKAHKVWEKRLQEYPDFMRYYRGWFGT